MKYLSFSLWGDKTIYNAGIISNVKLHAKGIYYNWKIVVYYDNSVPKKTIDTLKYFGVKLIDMTGTNIYGMFWRFFSEDLPNAEYSCFRDCDSRISLREQLAVNEWINSGKSLHVMRDHPAHIIPFGNDRPGILGGMWGIKSGAIPLNKMILDYVNNKELGYGADQTFLKSVYNLFENDKYTNDEFYEKKPFPIPRESGVFVGGRIDENEKPIGEDYMQVL